MAEIDVRPVEGNPCTIGEGPMWSSQHRALYWIDTTGKRVLRTRYPFERSEERPLPYKPSAVVLTDEGDLLVAYKKGVGLFDFDTGKYAQIEMVGVDFENEIFNDGACDSEGRLWIGTRDRQVSRPVGALYVLDGNFDAREINRGVVVSNGIAWSPDRGTFYHTDSRPGSITAYPFSRDGRLGEGRPFLDYASKGFRPDGCTVDAEGFLWVAEIEGGQVSRYAPDGSLDRRLQLPVSKPTSVMFGGDHLSELFVTSMMFGLSEPELASQPLAGKVLRIPLDIHGVAEHRFVTKDSRKIAAARAAIHGAAGDGDRQGGRST